MWYNPSLDLDTHYLQLIPTLDPLTLQQYPIEPTKLKSLIKNSLDVVNADAILGGTILWFAKNNIKNLKKQFPITHIENLDMFLFLISERENASNSEGTLLRYVKLVTAKLFKDMEKAQLHSFYDKLKVDLGVLQRALGIIKERENQKLGMIKVILNIFLSQIADSEPNRKKGQLSKRFQQHADFICKNKRQVTFVKVLYEMQYQLLLALHQVELSYDFSHICRYIDFKLAQNSIMSRLSVSIQIQSFILHKILQVKSLIDNQSYQYFLNLIEQTIHKNQINRLNLQQKTDFYAFHMKNNQYFHYLQALFEGFREKDFINKWKESLKEAIEKNIPELKREVQTQQINQVIFYLQLRHKSAYLWSDCQTVNHFPLLESRVVMRMILSSFLSNCKTGRQICICLIRQLFKGGWQWLLQQYRKMSNIIEKCIIVYYLMYYQANLKIPQQLQQIQRHQINTLIVNFIHNLSNDQVLQLLQFYVLQIQLGNYYNQTKSHSPFQNYINIHLYQTFAELAHFKLNNSINLYKQLDNTQDLNHILQFYKYFILLMKANCPELPTPFLCLNCKNINSTSICSSCQSLCIGLKFCPKRTQFNQSKQLFYYKNMYKVLKASIKQAYQQICRELQDSNSQWLNMLVQVLHTMTFL